MKNRIVLILVILTFSNCKNRQVQKEQTKLETSKQEIKHDTVFVDRIVNKEVVLHDTIEKKIYDFNLEGKPTYDPITKKWLPFVFDYSVSNGKDSTRYKGSFSGETKLNSTINYETQYKNLLIKYNEVLREGKSSDSNIVETTKFEEAKKAVQSEGYSFEMLIYLLGGVGLGAYLLGFFSPKIFGLAKNYIKTKIPFL